MDSIISFKDDLKPKFITSSFSEDYIPKEEQEAYERPDYEHNKQLSPGLAIVSSFMCVGYSWLAHLGTLKVLEVLEEGMQNLDTSKTPVAAARSALDQIVVGSGFLMVSLFGLYSMGLLVYAGVRIAQRGKPITYYRCDGKDKSCCEGKPQFSYLSNMRGYETERRKYMDIHLQNRPGCREIDPLIEHKTRPFW